MLGDDEQIEVGDYVTVGWGVLTWEVLQVELAQQRALVKSGFSGRRLWYPLEDLSLHTKGSK